MSFRGAQRRGISETLAQKRSTTLCPLGIYQNLGDSSLAALVQNDMVVTNCRCLALKRLTILPYFPLPPHNHRLPIQEQISLRLHKVLV